MADFGLTISVREGSNDGPPIQGAIVTGSLAAVGSDASGNAVVNDVLVTVEAPGFYPYVAQLYHRPSLQGPVVISLQRLPPAPAHVDPSGIPLEQLALVRGSLWTPRANLPHGPRPGKDDNILATDFFSSYSPDEQALALTVLKARGYTHAAVGPIVDSDGYHGQYPARDWRQDFDAFLDVLQLFWDNGIAPIVFIHPDGWTLDQTKELTPLFQSERAQRLMRIIVPGGWEPTKYGWSSVTWAAYGQWARQTWPNALVLLHTVADVDAPAGADELFNDDDHRANPLGNAGAWGRVAPYFHGWLTQSEAFANPTAIGDPNHPDKTNFQNWQDLFNPHVRGSYADRFRNGYAGWPTSSAWGSGVPLKVYAGEYASYWCYWNNRPESESQDWGDAAMRAGADGFMDGGR